MANYNDRGGRRSDDYKRPNRKNSDGFRYSDDRKPRFDSDRKPRFDGDTALKISDIGILSEMS